MADSTVEAIKEKLDIVDFIRGYVPLFAAGKNFKANCPFHKEKSPSFMVSPDRGSWHCFGCNIGGDVFSFLMRYENIEFPDALKILAEKAGVPLARQSAGVDYRASGLLYEINAAAKDFFVAQLAKSDVAKRYLEARKIAPGILSEFEVGWAPNEPEALNLYLLSANFAPDDIVRAGLAVRSERGLQFDRFRGRIMFPIHNHLGKVVGFTGRILPQFDTGQMGKYVNSPETPIFNKSKVLYGFWKAKDEMRQTKTAYLVEGQMDFLMSYQAGVKNAVATSGTALTEDHLVAIRRLADTLLVSFDNDAAGWAAGERAVEMAGNHDFAVKVVPIEGFKDPADAVAADPALLKRSLENAKPAMAVFIQRYLPKGKPDIQNREELLALRHLLQKIKSMPSPLERNHWVQELSRHTGIDEPTLIQESSRLAQAQPQSTSFRAQEEMPEEPKMGRRENLSRQMLAVSYALGKCADVAKEYLIAPYDTARDLLVAGVTKSEDPAIDKILNFACLAEVSASQSQFEDLQKRLKEECIKSKREDLSAAIKLAERAGNDAEVARLMEELSLLSRANAE